MVYIGDGKLVDTMTNLFIEDKIPRGRTLVCSRIIGLGNRSNRKCIELKPPKITLLSSGSRPHTLRSQ